MNVIEELFERGFIEKTTHEKELNDYINAGNVTCYIGFDPTADSFHIGSLVPIMALAHMQRKGHRPIALVGGGTGLIGDPSGKTEMRKMLTLEQIDKNAQGLKKQLSRFMDFSDGKALLLNNADWLVGLKLIPFLRDFGKLFSVNRMIKAESCKNRMESEEGLSFLEFNYSILQAYDYLQLFDQYNCRLQMGGNDQWGNIVAGIDPIRRLRQETVFGIVFPLLTTSGGEKMGKTAKGAVWLDPEKTSPYEYYQYWVNVDDRDVARFLALFTFLPINEIRRVDDLEGADLNSAKTILAFETTRIVHGKEATISAMKDSASVFGFREVPGEILPSSSIHMALKSEAELANPEGGEVPRTLIAREDLAKGIPAFKLFTITGLAESGGEARRLIKQGGAYINGRRVSSIDELISDRELENDEILLRAGKKRYHKVKIGQGVKTDGI